VRTLGGIALDPPAALRASRLDGRARPGLAAQCWALAHRLLVGAGGADREAFVRYVEDQLSGVDEAVAWQRHLGHVTAGADSSERGAGTLTLTLPGSPVPEVEARRLGPAEVDALLGELLLDRGRPMAARPLLESALSADPSQPVALAAMGRLARLEGSLDLAVAMSRRALEADPDERAVAAELASALLAREGEAPSRELAEVEELLALLARSGSEIEPPWIELAAIYARSDRESRGDFSRTVSVCRLAVTSEPSSSWRRILLARALLIGGAVEQARWTAREAAALAIASTDPVAANNVCWYGAVGGLAAGVAAACDRAVELRPQRGLYRDSRAVVRALTGDLPGAAEDLRVFLGSADASPPAIRAQRSTWLEELERGESPFDERTLAALSDLPF